MQKQKAELGMVLDLNLDRDSQRRVCVFISVLDNPAPFRPSCQVVLSPQLVPVRDLDRRDCERPIR